MRSFIGALLGNFTRKKEPPFSAGTPPEGTRGGVVVCLEETILCSVQRQKDRLQLGKAALASRNFPVARAYFTSVLEKDPSALAALVGLRWLTRKEAEGVGMK
jgi:hypothetical protein